MHNIHFNLLVKTMSHSQNVNKIIDKSLESSDNFEFINLNAKKKDSVTSLTFKSNFDNNDIEEPRLRAEYAIWKKMHRFSMI